MPKPDALADLAGKLLDALGRLRDGGPESYPLTVAGLAAMAAPPAAPEEAVRALAHRSLAGRVVVARKRDPASPVALAEDAERLAASPLLLDYALGRICTARKPLHPLSRVLTQVDPPLRPAFEAALRRQLAEHTLPPTAGSTEVRGKPSLYRADLPPPALGLAQKLLHQLHELRRRGDYPPTLDRLAHQAAATPDLLKKALNESTFKSQTILALPKSPQTPLALAEDAGRLASSPLLLTTALAAARTPENQAVTVADLKKKVLKGLQAAFAEAVGRSLAARSLPAEVGLLRIKKKPYLFLLREVGAPPAPTPAPAPAVGRAPAAAPADFARLFEEAFDRLDRQKGSHNHVSLLDLRRAVPAERAAFDAVLQALRRAGRYSLSAAEGRHGLSAEEREAAVAEDGSLLLFVSRRVQ